MKRLTIICAAVAMFLLPACAQKQTKTMEQKKALVVFFSHAGENYSVGNIKVGNTKIVADYISELTGADQFEIVTHKYDGMSYKKVCDVAQDEQIADERPAFEGSIVESGKLKVESPTQADFEQYEVIFIGGPVWWGTWPQVMFTFFDTYDLNGKTIYPFTTHEGSGLGSCVQDLKSNYPRADVQKGFSIYGHEVKNGKAKVEKWLNSIGF